MSTFPIPSRRPTQNVGRLNLLTITTNLRAIAAAVGAANLQSVRPIPPLTLDPRLSSTSPGVTPFCLVRGRLRVHRSRTSFGDPVRCPGRIFDFSESWRDPAKALGVSTAGLQVRDDLIADAAAVANEHHVPDTAVRPVRLRCHKPRRYPTVGAHWRTDRRLGWLALHDRAPRPYRRERAWSLGHRRLDQAAADDAQSLIAIEPLRESNRNFVCRVSDVGTPLRCGAL